MAKFDGVASANWFKNVAKSLGYTATDVLGDLMPVSVETIKTSVSDIKEIKDTLRESKSSSSSLSKFLDSKTSSIKSNLVDLKSNVKSDLKSGNFNNKKRADEAFNKSMGLDDFDFDFDGDFSFDDELSDDSFSDVSTSSEINVVNTTNDFGTDPAVASEIIDAVQTQSQILVETSRRSSEENIALAKIQIANDKEIGNILYTGVSAINSNVSLLVDFNRTQTSAYIGASLKYYEDSIRVMTDVVTELKKLTTPKEEYNSRQSSFDSFMSGDEFSLKSYMEFVKKNAKNHWLLSMIPGFGDDSMGGGFLSNIVANPLGELSKIMTKSLIPKMIQTTMKEFDDSIKSFIPNLLTKIYNKGTTSDNPIFEFLGEMLGVKNSTKTSIRTEYYNKGLVPFDGVTRKSIVEVIPTYLSKIYSAISGKEEVLYDFEEGKFKSKSKIREDVERDEKVAAIYQYDSLYEIEKAAKKRMTEDEYKSKDFEEKIEKFFVELSKTSQTFNPRKKSDDSDVISKLFTNLDGTIDKDEQELFREIILNLPKSLIQSIAADQQKAIHSVSEFYRKAESSGNNTNLLSLLNGTFDEEFSVSGKGSIFTPQDKYGKTSLDYLRNINHILLDKVPVYNVSPDPDRDKKLSEFLSTKPTSPVSSKIKPDGGVGSQSSGSLEEEEIREELIRKYKLSGEDISDEDFEKEVQKELKRKKAREKIEGSPTDKYGPVYNFISKMLKKINMGPLSEKFEAGIDKIIGAVSSFTGKIETKMYELIFGKDESEEGSKKPSFFSKIKETITTPFKKAWDKLDEKLFGKEGFFSKIEDSEFYKGLKEKASKAWNWLAGDIDPETGKRSGGLMSDVANEMKDFKDKFTSYFTGRVKVNGKYEIVNDNSVFDNIKGMAGSFRDNIKTWLFGDASKEEIKEKSKGIFSSIGDMFKGGIETFSNVFFGSTIDADGKETSKISSSEIINKIKERAPKSIAGGIIGLGASSILGAGGFGILGSLFLGPMSGIAIGMGSAFLSQSDKFKDWFFGKTDEETGERVGGVISKSTQNFFKKHKSGLIGGTVFGALKGMLGIGFLPTILGGPLTGALMGLTSSLIIRSNSFQKLLFGEMDEKTGKRSGGLLGKISTKVGDSDFKKKFGTILTGGIGGAGLGSLLGSFGTLGALAFGPLSGAIAGVASGILLSSDKWKNRIFGTPDENGNRGHDGLLNKMLDTVTREVLMPAKLKVTEWKFNVKEWFDEKIAEPVLHSLDPIREEFSRLRNRISVFFKDFAKNFHIPEFITDISDSIKAEFSKAAKVIGEFGSKIMGGIGKILGGVASAPFKLVEMVADKILLPKHMKEGLASVRKLLIENIKETFTYKHFIEPIGKAITTVTDFAKGAISGTFDFMKEAIKRSFKFAAKTIADIITAPFKVIGGGISAIFSGIGSIKNLLTPKKDGQSDQSIISNILTGNKSFLGSVGSLAATFIPGSKTRRAAQYAAFSDDELRERIRNSYLERGETISDEDLEAELRDTRERTPEGASYQKTREEMRKEREAKRKKDKERHKEALSRMREVMRNGGSLSDMNRVIDSYTESGMDGSELAKLKEEASKLSDKVLGKRYGKEYSGKSKIEQDKFKADMDADKATVENAETTKNIFEYVKEIATKGIRVSSKEPEVDEEKEPTSSIDESVSELREDHSVLIPSPPNVLLNAGSEDSDPNNDPNGEESKRYNLEHQTLGYTEKESRMDRAVEEEAEAKKSLSQRLLEKLTSIDETGKSHSEQWGEIFGKAGLITLGVTAAVGLISKIIGWISQFGNPFSSETIVQALKEFFGTEDSDGDRTDSSGDTQTNDDAIEAGLRGVAWTAGTIKNGIKKIKEKITKSSIYQKFIDKKTGKKTAKEAAEEATQKTAKEAAEEATQKTAKEAAEEATEKVVQNSDNVGDNIFSKFTKGNTDEVIDSAKLLGDGGSIGSKTPSPSKFINQNADEAIEASYELLDGSGNTIGKYNAKTGKYKTTSGADDILSKADDGLINKFKTMVDDAIKALKDFITKKIPNLNMGKLGSVFGKLTGIFSKLKGKVAKSFIGKITKGIASIAASAATFFVTDAVWVTYGAISGATVSETANLFRVSQDSVNETMQFISGLFKAILNYSWFFVIQLANDILIALTGEDFLYILATSLYSGMMNFIGNTEAVTKLNDAQAEFGRTYDDYTLIEQIAKGNVEYNEDGSIKYDKDGNLVLKDPKKVESFDSFNDRTNGTLASKIGEKVKGGFKSIKRWFTGDEQSEEDIARMEELTAQEESLKQAVANGIIAEDNEVYIQTMEKIQKEKRALSGADSLGALLESGPAGFFKKVSEFGDKLKTTISNVFGKVNDTLGTDIVFSSEYWALPETGDKDMNLISKVLFYGKRILTFIPAAVMNIGGKAFNIIKKIITPFMAIGKFTFTNATDAISDILNGDHVFTGAYWTPPTTEEGESAGAIANILFYLQRVVFFGPAAILSLYKGTFDGIKKIIGFGKKLNEYASDVDVDDLGETYFEYTGEDDDSLTSKIDKAGFYIARGIKLPLLHIKKTFAPVIDGIKKFIGNVTDLKDSAKNYADVDVEDLGDNYFKYTGKNDGSLTSKIDEAGFYIGRGIMYPILKIKKFFGTIFDKIKGAMEWLKEKSGWDTLISGNYTFGTGGGITKGYPKVRGPISPDNITEGIHSGGVGGSGYEMFKNFGKQTAGYPSYNNSKKPHYGVDRSTRSNSAVPSFTEGKVVEVVNKYAPNSGANIEGHQGGFGNYVKIRDADGGTNIYAHLNKVNVKRGDIVKTGDKIGREGHTGHSTGTHLHYETWAGANRNSVIDPYLYLRTRRDKRYTGGGITSGYPRKTGYISIDNLLEGIYHGGVGGSSTPGYDLFNKEYKPNQNPGRPFSSGHLGVDYWLKPYKKNAPVKSLTNGTVETAVNSYAPNSGFLGSKAGGGYGNYVMIRDSNKNRIYYAHLNDVYVRTGDKVKVGDKLGIQGHTGNSSGEHLHLEARRGNVTPRSAAAMNPATYFTSGGFEQTLTNGSGSSSTDVNGVNTTTTSVGAFGGVFDIVISKLNDLISNIQVPISNITTKLTDLLTPLLGGSLVSTNVVDNLANSATSDKSSFASATTDLKDTGGTGNARAIWNYYKKMGLSDYTISGILANLRAESNLNPKNLQQSYERSLGYTDDSYTSGVDSGSYKNFVKDSAGYGLAQWTYHSRKKKLLDFAKSKNVSIGDLGMQLEYLIKELKESYSGTWNRMQSASSAKEASDIMLREFEKPAVLNYNTRAGYANSYYNQFATGGDNSIYTSGLLDNDQYDEGFTYSTSNIDKFATTKNKPVYSTSNAINELKESINNIGANAGGGSEIPERVYTLLDKVVSVLNDISDNTKSTSDNVDKLNKKETPEQPKNNNTTVVNTTNKTNNTMYDVANKRREAKKNQNYSNAQLIASGVH